MNSKTLPGMLMSGLLALGPQLEYSGRTAASDQQHQHLAFARNADSQAPPQARATESAFYTIPGACQACHPGISAGLALWSPQLVE